MTKWRMLGAKEQDGKLVYSDAQAESDIAAVKELHRKQVEKFGDDAVGDFPRLNHWPVELAIVFEREGKIIGCMYGECILEMCMIGDDPRATVRLKRSAPSIKEFFKEKGFRLLRTFIPRVAEKRIPEELAGVGFKNQDREYQHFLLDLR